jgi:hypothetical protein
MAKIKNNPFLMGVSGMIGGQMVVRQTPSGPVMAHAPKSSRRNPSDAQKAQRARFSQAAHYATAACHLPQYKKIADRRGVSARSVAIADFLNPPEVRDIILTNYKGKVGDTILVRAIDDVQVQSVSVVITDAQGVVIEQGPCKHPDHDLTRWTYVATRDAAASLGKVVAEATDLASHSTQLSRDWAG